MKVASLFLTLVKFGRGGGAQSHCIMASPLQLQFRNFVTAKVCNFFFVPKANEFELLFMAKILVHLP